MMLLSIAAMTVAAVLRKCLVGKLGVWEAAFIDGLFYVVAIVVAAAILSPINEVHSAFPGVVLWHCRVDSAAKQIIMWAVLGLGFGALTERTFIAKGIYRPRLSPALLWQ